MNRAQFTQTTAFAACAAIILWCPMTAGPARAQQASAPVLDDGVTTVAPLMVTPPPMVGDGVNSFTPQEFEKSQAEAHDELVGAREDGSLCPRYGKELESNGDFSLAALYHTDADAETVLEAASERAKAATLAALDARAAAASGKISDQAAASAELARQSAVKAYQAASRAATEALQRIADMQSQIGLWQSRGELVSIHMMDIWAEVNRRTRERSQVTGTPGVYVPGEYQDLGLTGIIARRTTVKGETVMRVTGKIQNPRAAAIPVPPLWVTAVDDYGIPLKSDQATASVLERRIPAGGSVPFVYDLKPVPDRTVRAVVTFAPRERKPRIQSMRRELCGTSIKVPGWRGGANGGYSAMTSWTTPLAPLPRKSDPKATK